jgi:hypothetical protein
VSTWIQGIAQPTVAADIVEYNPRCDVSDLTAMVAARLAKEIVGGMTMKNRISGNIDAAIATARDRWKSARVCSAMQCDAL